MRNIYKYELKKGNKLVYVGITNNPERRKSEHLLEGKDFDKINLVGSVSTLKGALEWETDRIHTYMNNHNGETPKYNKNTTGQ